MLRITSDGDFKNTIKSLEDMASIDIFEGFDGYGQLGVNALGMATPVDSGQTASSWGYRVITDRRHPGIIWINNNTIRTGTPIVILLQYGHGTGTGGYVVGRDFINPAIQPIFDRIELEVWRKVTNA